MRLKFLLEINVRESNETNPKQLIRYFVFTYWRGIISGNQPVKQCTTLKSPNSQDVPPAALLYSNIRVNSNE
jgi:hypothetical protein